MENGDSIVFKTGNDNKYYPFYGSKVICISYAEASQEIKDTINEDESYSITTTEITWTCFVSEAERTTASERIRL